MNLAATWRADVLGRWPAWAGPVLGALLLSIGWIGGLSLAPLLDVDEGAFAEASREMLADGDWGHTTLNGADRFDKPILVYWLQALSLAAFGASEFAVRLPSALCAIGWTLAVWAFARPRWGATAAGAAASVLATSLGPMLIGRAATADALLNLLLTLTVLDLWRALERPRDRSALRRAFAWAGLGLLAKGPVAVVVPLGALLCWAYPARGGGMATVARVLGDWRAWGLCVGIAAPWYAYAGWRHGAAFVEGFFLRHNLDRFAGPLEGHGGTALYHFVSLPLLMWPWTPLLVWLVLHAKPMLAEPALRFLAGWCGFVLLFFTLAGTKLPHYMLYGFTPLALACGWLVGQGRLPKAALLAVALTVGLTLAVGAASPAWAAWFEPRGADAAWRAVLGAAARSEGPSPAVAGLLGMTLACGIWWGWRRDGSAWLPWAWAPMLGAGWWVCFVLPWWAHALQDPVKTLALEARQRGLVLVQWNVHRPSAGFYRGAPVPRRAPRPGEAALVREDHLSKLATEAERSPEFELLRRDRGYALVQVSAIGGPP